MPRHQRTRYTKVVHEGLTREEHIFSQENKERMAEKIAILKNMCDAAVIYMTLDGLRNMEANSSRMDEYLIYHFNHNPNTLTVKHTPIDGFKSVSWMKDELRQALIEAYGEDAIQKTEKKPAPAATVAMAPDDFVNLSKRINRAKTPVLQIHVLQTPVLQTPAEEIQLFSTTEKILEEGSKLEISLKESDFAENHFVKKPVKQSGFFRFFSFLTFGC